MKNILVISDNQVILSRIVHELGNADSPQVKNASFSFSYSRFNTELQKVYQDQDWISPLSIKASVEDLIDKYDLIISLHCKQFFPEKLVKSVRCINVHPGLNPYNRGWYPQVFSIINGLPSGVTIHEMDEQLDHGPIIAQKEVPVRSDDTSFSLYNRIIEEEVTLFFQHLPSIIEGDYQTRIPEEGNLNLREDFDQLCALDLNDTDTFQNHINQLRALTHGAYSNAYFLDEEGNKIYISVQLTKQ